MNSDSECAQMIREQLENIIAMEDAILPGVRKFFLIALDENGDIAYYRNISEGRRLVMLSDEEMQKIKERKEKENEQVEQYKKRLAESALKKSN